MLGLSSRVRLSLTSAAKVHNHTFNPSTQRDARNLQPMRLSQVTRSILLRVSRRSRLPVLRIHHLAPERRHHPLDDSGPDAARRHPAATESLAAIRSVDGSGVFLPAADRLALVVAVDCAAQADVHFLSDLANPHLFLLDQPHIARDFTVARWETGPANAAGAGSLSESLDHLGIVLVSCVSEGPSRTSPAERHGRWAEPKKRRPCLT